MDPDAEWDRQARQVPGAVDAAFGEDIRVEVDTLRANSKTVNLVFVNLQDYADPEQNQASLYAMLYNGHTKHTVLAAGGAVNRVHHYDKDTVLSLPDSLFRLFQPTVVRVQDAQPDRRAPEDPNWAYDHSDHVMTARFALEALRTRGYSSRVQVVVTATTTSSRPR
ncbi:hypothetical protein ACIGNX_29940 [Actinosynnema sp. NPDC053489]|uniref:hypothetical protein n=1 Tax=Actinosynnema sp. NPDC053489 TaxID=3363916 RepID=UPI0037CC46FD